MALAFALASCQHTPAFMSRADLEGIARSALAREHVSVDGLDVEVLDRGDKWVVWFRERKPSVLDGGTAVLISKKTTRVLGVASDA